MISRRLTLLSGTSLAALSAAGEAIAQSVIPCPDIGHEAPAGLVITTANTTLNASPTPGSAGLGNRFTITAGKQIAVNGVVIGGANVDQLISIAHCAFQRGSNAYYGPMTASSTGNTQLTGSPLPTILLSNSSVAAGSPSGTTIGTLSVTTGLSNATIGTGAYTWTYRLRGTTAVHVVGSTLVTNGVVPAGSFTGTVYAFNPQVLGSPFSLPFTLTVSGASSETQAGTVVSGTGTAIHASSTPGSPGSQLSITITSGAQVAVNGVTATGTSGVTGLVYIDHTCYQNGGGAFYGPVTSTTSTGTNPVGSPLPVVILSGSTSIGQNPPAGTVIGPITVTTGLPNGTIGTGAYSFGLSWSGSTGLNVSGSNLVTVGSLANGSYSGTITATQASILGGPWTLGVTVLVNTSSGVTFPAVGYSSQVPTPNDPVAAVAGYPNNRFVCNTQYNGYYNWNAWPAIGSWAGDTNNGDNSFPYYSVQVSAGPRPSDAGVAFNATTYINNALAAGTAMGQHIVAFGEQNISSINLGWEFNQGGAMDFGWDGNPGEIGGTSGLANIAYFIQFFRTVVQGIRINAKNVIIAFCGNQYNIRTGGNLADYYPGDDVCQAVMLDGYLAFSNGIPPQTALNTTYGCLQTISQASLYGPNHPARNTGSMVYPVGGQTVAIPVGGRLYCGLPEWQDNGNPGTITQVMNWLYGTVGDRSLSSAYWTGYSVAGGEPNLQSGGNVTAAGNAYGNAARGKLYPAPYPIPHPPS